MAPRINIPSITRSLLISLVVLSLLNAAARYRSWEVDKTTGIGSRQYYAPYLTIVPGMSIQYPWVFVTATLAEQNPAGLIVTGATLFWGGKYLERAWGSTEYTKFIALVSLVPNLLTFLAYVSLYVVTRNPSLASTSISGGIAIQAGFLVSFKQLVPEHTISLLRGIIRVRVKHLPAIFLVANTVSGFALGTDTAMMLSWIGFCASWTYLRFYRISPSLSTAVSSNHQGERIRGDASDTFAFAYFFPDAIHPFVAAISDAVYNALVALRVCTPFSAEETELSNEQAMARGDGGLPSLLNSTRPGRGGGRREEAERRRALALRALDARLQNVRPPPVAHTGNNTLSQAQYQPDGDTHPQKEEMVVRIESEESGAV